MLDTCTYGSLGFGILTFDRHTSVVAPHSRPRISCFRFPSSLSSCVDSFIESFLTSVREIIPEPFIIVGSSFFPPSGPDMPFQMPFSLHTCNLVAFSGVAVGVQIQRYCVKKWLLAAQGLRHQRRPSTCHKRCAETGRE